jgi:hypothetical protein
VSDTSVRRRQVPGWRTRGSAASRARAVALVGPGVLDPYAFAAGMTGLPVWPLVAMFALMPVWWGLGILYFLWPFFGILLFGLLTTRGKIRIPAGATPWLIFLGIALVSGIRLTRATQVYIFGLRIGYLFTAFMVCLYVYNLVRDGVPWSRVVTPLAVYWLSLIALGWLGVLAPKLSLPSPFMMALPHGVAATEYVSDVSRIDATEFNRFSLNPIYRPAAPYPYTNNWGTAYAFLVPFVLACLTSLRHEKLRFVLLLSLPVSLVPAFYTLNRGMFIGLGAGVVYLLGREVLRGRFRLVLPVAGIVLLGWLVTLYIPVIDLISHRTSTTDTNFDRFDIYRQTWAAVLDSPLLGYGQPNSVDTTHAAEPLGTQGMLWQMLYSHGIPATICFFLFFAIVARRLAAAVTPAGLWLSALPIIAVVITPFYGYGDPNTSVLFFALGLGLAAVDGPVNRTVKAAYA